jgi:hypothetical protein
VTARAVALTAAIAVALTAGPARADDARPSTGRLVAAGAGMALPTYAIGVLTHEGSHALAAKLMGAELTELRLLPGRHPRTGKFYFGYVGTRGLTTRSQRARFLLAPKLTDALLLGGYAAITLGDHLPDSRYGQLALTVLATGFWVDFSKDVIAWWDHNDVVKVYSAYGATTELRRLPLRLLHAGLAVAGGYAIVRGYQSVFADDAAPTSAAFLPLWSVQF